MKTTTFSTPQALTSTLIPTLHFTRALLKGNLRDRRALITTLFTPIFMLTIFWLLSGSPEDGDFDLIAFMFPAIVGFGVMFSGAGQALRLLNWREQEVFQRLAATPVPLGNLVMGAALAQTILGTIQGIFILLFGVLVIQIPVNILGTVLTVLVLALGSACFIAFGSLIASLAPKAETANTIYTFSILPMFFFGGGFPPEVLPAFIQKVSPWLPTAMFTELVRPLLSTGALVQGLAGYTVIFSVLAAKRFRWEA